MYKQSIKLASFAALFAVAFTFTSTAFAQAPQPAGTSCDSVMMAKYKEAQDKLVELKCLELGEGEVCKDGNSDCTPQLKKQMLACRAVLSDMVKYAVSCGNKPIVKRARRYTRVCEGEAVMRKKASKYSLNECTCDHVPGSVQVNHTDHRKGRVTTRCAPSMNRMRTLEQAVEKIFDRVKANEDKLKKQAAKIKEIRRKGVGRDDALRISSANDKAHRNDIERLGEDLGDVRKGLTDVERRILRLAVGPGVEFEDSEAGFAFTAPVTACLTGLFTTHAGIGVCGKMGFYTSATTGPGFMAGGSVGPILAINNDHRFMIGFYTDQIIAEGEGKGYDLGVEVRYFGQLVGPLVISPKFNIGSGYKAGRYEDTGKEFGIPTVTYSGGVDLMVNTF